MCDEYLVRDMINKHKPKPLRCLANTKCWCMMLDKRFIHSDDILDCLSPEEMLRSKSACFSELDLAYLKNLSGLEWLSE